MSELDGYRRNPGLTRFAGGDSHRAHPGSYGYRPQRAAHDAVSYVSQETTRGKTFVIDLDLRFYFDPSNKLASRSSG